MITPWGTEGPSAEDQWCARWGSENPELENAIRELIVDQSERVKQAVEAMLEDIDEMAKSIARRNNTNALSYRNEELKKMLELLEAFKDQMEVVLKS